MWHCQIHFSGGDGGGVLGDESSRLFPADTSKPAFGGDEGVRGGRGEKGDGGMESLEGLNGTAVIVSGFGILLAGRL